MVETYYLIYLKRNFSKDKERFFVCTKNRRDEFSKVSVFHGIGYWYTGNILTIFNDNEQRDECEVWIPWGEIDYIQSLMYKQKIATLKDSS